MTRFRNRFGFGLGLWCLMPLLTNFSYITAVSFIGGGNRNAGENHQLLEVTDNLYHILLYRVHLA